MTTGGVTAAVGYQTIWSPRYIDAPILRDTLNTAGTGIVTAQRVFYLADANYNVTGLVKYDSGTSKWQVAERYTYTPYGVVTYRNADWTVAGSSANSQQRPLHRPHAGALPPASTTTAAATTMPGLERFINTDPISYKGGINLYEYVGDDPLTRTDPSGELTFKVWGNFCGPGWCGGKYQPEDKGGPSSYNVPPTDSMDACCKASDCVPGALGHIHRKAVAANVGEERQAVRQGHVPMLKSYVRGFTQHNCETPGHSALSNRKEMDCDAQLVLLRRASLIAFHKGC